MKIQSIETFFFKKYQEGSKGLSSPLMASSLSETPVCRDEVECEDNNAGDKPPDWWNSSGWKESTERNIHVLEKKVRLVLDLLSLMAKQQQLQDGNIRKILRQATSATGTEADWLIKPRMGATTLRRLETSPTGNHVTEYALIGQFPSKVKNRCFVVPNSVLDPGKCMRIPLVSELFSWLHDGSPALDDLPKWLLNRYELLRPSAPLAFSILCPLLLYSLSTGIDIPIILARIQTSDVYKLISLCADCESPDFLPCILHERSLVGMERWKKVSKDGAEILLCSNYSYLFSAGSGHQACRSIEKRFRVASTTFLEKPMWLTGIPCRQNVKGGTDVCVVDETSLEKVEFVNLPKLCPCSLSHNTVPDSIDDDDDKPLSVMNSSESDYDKSPSKEKELQPKKRRNKKAVKGKGKIVKKKRGRPPKQRAVSESEMSEDEQDAAREKEVHNKLPNRRRCGPPQRYLESESEASISPRRRRGRRSGEGRNKDIDSRSPISNQGSEEGGAEPYEVEPEINDMEEGVEDDFIELVREVFHQRVDFRAEATEDAKELIICKLEPPDEMNPEGEPCVAVEETNGLGQDPDNDSSGREGSTEDLMTSLQKTIRENRRREKASALLTLEHNAYLLRVFTYYVRYGISIAMDHFGLTRVEVNGCLEEVYAKIKAGDTTFTKDAETRLKVAKYLHNKLVKNPFDHEANRKMYSIQVDSCTWPPERRKRDASTVTPVVEDHTYLQGTVNDNIEHADCDYHFGTLPKINFHLTDDGKIEKMEVEEDDVNFTPTPIPCSEIVVDPVRGTIDEYPYAGEAVVSRSKKVTILMKRKKKKKKKIGNLAVTKRTVAKPSIRIRNTILDNERRKKKEQEEILRNQCPKSKARKAKEEMKEKKTREMEGGTVSMPEVPYFEKARDWLEKNMGKGDRFYPVDEDVYDENMEMREREEDDKEKSIEEGEKVKENHLSVVNNSVDCITLNDTADEEEDREGDAVKEGKEIASLCPSKLDGMLLKSEKKWEESKVKERYEMRDEKVPSPNSLYDPRAAPRIEKIELDDDIVCLGETSSPPVSSHIGKDTPPIHLPYSSQASPLPNPFLPQAPPIRLRGPPLGNPYLSQAPPIIDPYSSQAPPIIDPYSSQAPPIIDPYSSQAPPIIDPYSSQAPPPPTPLSARAPPFLVPYQQAASLLHWYNTTPDVPLNGTVVPRRFSGTPTIRYSSHTDVRTPGPLSILCQSSTFLTDYPTLPMDDDWSSRTDPYAVNPVPPIGSRNIPTPLLRDSINYGMRNSPATPVDVPEEYQNNSPPFMCEESMGEYLEDSHDFMGNNPSMGNTGVSHSRESVRLPPSNSSKWKYRMDSANVIQSTKSVEDPEVLNREQVTPGNYVPLRKVLSSDVIPRRDSHLHRPDDVHPDSYRNVEFRETTNSTPSLGHAHKLVPDHAKPKNWTSWKAANLIRAEEPNSTRSKSAGNSSAMNHQNMGPVKNGPDVEAGHRNPPKLVPEFGTYKEWQSWRAENAARAKQCSAHSTNDHLSPIGPAKKGLGVGIDRNSPTVPLVHPSRPQLLFPENWREWGIRPIPFKKSLPPSHPQRTVSAPSVPHVEKRQSIPSHSNQNGPNVPVNNGYELVDLTEDD